MESRPRGVRAAIILLQANALLWFAFSVYTAAGAHPSFGADSAYRWPASLFAFLIAAGLGILALLLREARRLVFWAAVVFLAAIVFGFLFDQFGLADLAVAAVTAAPWILLIANRSWYLRRGAAEEHGAA